MANESQQQKDLPTNNQVAEALDAFVRRYLACYRQSGRNYPSQPADPEWPSPCVLDERDSDGDPCWQPVKRQQPADLKAMADALELSLHPSITPFFCSFFSDPLDAQWQEYRLQLLQPWNEQDFERLQQNLIGHVLMKRRLKQPVTLFIGCGVEDESIVSLDNASGEVWLEWPGKLPHLKLADSLEQFIDDLLPVAV